MPFILKDRREEQESVIFEGWVSPGVLFLKCRIGVGPGNKRRVGEWNKLLLKSASPNLSK